MVVKVKSGFTDLIQQNLIMFQGPVSVAQLNACLTDDQVTGSILHKVWHYSFLEIDHEILSTVIPPILLIQEEQLSVCGEGMCISTG